jgi:integrase
VSSDKLGLRFHDLRHTAASIAALNGAQPKEVQRMLGHASMTITMDRYTHLFPEQQEDLAARMDSALRAVLEPPPLRAAE